MWNTLITIIITFLATSLDEIPVLYFLYRRFSSKGEGRTITASYMIGSLLLILLSILGALGLVQIPVTWMVGLFGLLPFGMGIKTLFISDDDDDKKEELRNIPMAKALWVQVLMITLAFGIDDLGIYIPLFTTFNLIGFALIVFVVVIGATILCYISHRLTTIDHLSQLIRKRECLIEGMTFIIIGIYVMLEQGVFARLIHLIF